MMSEFVKIDFSSLDDLKATAGSRGEETLVMFVAGELKLGETAESDSGRRFGPHCNGGRRGEFQG